MDTQDQHSVEPRGPMSEEMMIDEIKGLLDANTLIDAVRILRELKESMAALKPIVSVDTERRLHFAPLTVRQTMQLMAALEKLTVQ